MEEKDIKSMSLDERIKDYEEIKKESDLSPTLEYFYSKLYPHVIDSEIVDYYDSLQSGQSRNTTVNKVYKTSNEDLDEKFSHIDIKGKRVATVGSGGEQALHAIYNGASEVDLIDLNIMAKPYVELKIAAIKGLSFDEFKEFFSNISDNLPKYYSKFSHNLKGESKTFWDEVVLEGKAKYVSHFEHNNEIFGSNYYSDEESYNKLKNILLKGDCKLNFIMSEFENFPEKLNGKYDLILLSNIFDYFATNLADGKNVGMFADTLMQLYKNNLEDHGAIEASSRGSNFAFVKIARKLKAQTKTIKGCGIGGRSSSVFFIKGRFSKIIKDCNIM